MSSIESVPTDSGDIWNKVLQGTKLDKPDLVLLGRAVKDETTVGRFLFALTPRIMQRTNDKILTRIASSWLKQQNYGIAEHLLGASTKKEIKQEAKALVDVKSQLINFSKPPDRVIVPDNEVIANAMAKDLLNGDRKDSLVLGRLKEEEVKELEVEGKVVKSKDLHVDRNPGFEARLKNDFMIRSSVGDGNCLFDSCLEGETRNPQELRQLTYQFMQANRYRFEKAVQTLLIDDLNTLTDPQVTPFDKERLISGVPAEIADIYYNLTDIHTAFGEETFEVMRNEWLKGAAFDDYCTAMSSTKGYGTLVEITALSVLLDKPIRVYSIIYETNGPGYIDVPDTKSFDPTHALYLLYHEEYKHYERLQPK